MDILEKKKKQSELLKMQSNIMDCEIRIEEKLLEIERIKDQVAKFEEHAENLKQLIKG